MQMTAPISNDRASTLNGWDYLSILRQQQRIIYACLVVCCVLAIAARFLMPAKYESRVVTVPAPSDNATKPISMGALSSLGLSLGGDNADVKEVAVATLNARSFLIDFINRENLLPVLFANKWDKANKRWTAKPPTDEEAYDKLHDAMSVASLTTNNLINVSVRWTDPSTAAFIANHLVQSLNRQSQNKAIAEDNRMIQHLSETYNNIQISELRANIANLIQDQIRQRILAQSRDEYTLRIIDPAFPSKKRVSPPGLAILLPLAVFLGLLFGISGAFLVHSAQPQWRGPLARWLAPRP